MRREIYTLDQASAALNIGRNTLARRLRDDAHMLDKNNRPTSRYRGSPYMRVEHKSFHHPDKGRVPYTRVLFTRRGLRHIARVLDLDGVQFSDDAVVH